MEIVDKYWERKGKEADRWTAKKEDQVVLIQLIEKYNLKSFFEIGTHTAFTTELLASHPNIKNWKSIDIHSNHAHFNIIRCSSEGYDPDGETFDLVFIDGDHFQVKRDTELALKMKPKIIAWHDYNSTDDEVKKIVQRDVNLYKPINVEANVAWKKL